MAGDIVDEVMNYSEGGSKTPAGKSSTVKRKPGQSFKGDKSTGKGSNVQKVDVGGFIKSRRGK